MKYWKFTEETKVSFTGEVLRRIVCTEDFLHAKKRDLGGWLGENAVLKDNAWIAYEAKVFGNASVFGNAEVCGNARVGGNASVSNTAKVFGNAIVCDDEEKIKRGFEEACKPLMKYLIEIFKSNVR